MVMKLKEISCQSCFLLFFFLVVCSLYAHEGLIDTDNPLTLNELWNWVNNNISYQNSNDILVEKDFLGVHPAIVILAIEEFNRLYPVNKISEKNLRLMILGSILEDWNIDWSNLKNFKENNLFEYIKLGRLPDAYNDLKFYNNANDNLRSQHIGWFTRCFNHFLSGGSNGYLTDFTSISNNSTKIIYPTDAFAYGDENGTPDRVNNMGYKVIIKNSENREPEEHKWFRMGHVLHLLGDMTSPSHVRNDDHSPFTGTSRFEKYFSKIKNFNVPFNSKYHNRLIINLDNGNLEYFFEDYKLKKTDVDGDYTLSGIFRQSAKATAEQWYSEDTIFTVRWVNQDLEDPLKLQGDKSFRVFYIDKKIFITSGYKDKVFKRCDYALAYIDQEDNLQKWYKKYNHGEPDTSLDRHNLCQFFESELKKAKEDGGIGPIYIDWVSDFPKDNIKNVDTTKNKAYFLNIDWSKDPALSRMAKINDDRIRNTWITFALRESVKQSVRLLYQFHKTIKPATIFVTPLENFSSSGPFGGPFNPTSKIFKITDNGYKANWKVTTNVEWLDINPKTGTTPSDVTITINDKVNTFQSGLYTGTISFINETTGLGNTDKTVTLLIKSVMDVTPTENFSSIGQKGGPFNPIGKTYTINAKGGNVDWEISTNQIAWLDVDFSNGTASPTNPSKVTISLNNQANNLDVGKYNAIINFTNSNGEGNTNKQVTLTVTAGPIVTMSVSPTEDFICTGEEGGPFNPNSKIYNIFAQNGSVNWQIEESKLPWLNITPTDGTAIPGNPSLVTFTLKDEITSTLPVGNYNKTIVFKNITNSDQNIIARQATLTIVNTLPKVTIIKPTNGSTFTAPAEITMEATAIDPNKSISKVDFYSGSNLLYTDISSPYTYTWNNVSEGNYSLTAKATNNLGATVTSMPVNIIVTNNPEASWKWNHPLPQGNMLYGIWVGSPTNIYAVGLNGTILHYNGTKWTIIDTKISCEHFRGVWGSSESNVFVVGSYGTILHYDGNIWTKMNSGVTEHLEAISGFSSSNIFVVGAYGTILHYNGNTWTKMNSGIFNYLNSVWCIGNNEVLVAGSRIILYYDGITWQTIYTTIYPFAGIWGTSKDNIFAVGDDGKIVHYDGNKWIEMNSNVTCRLESIWGISNNNIFAVGWNGTILHYNGLEWTVINTKDVISSTIFKEISGSSDSNIFIVGRSGVIIYYDGENWKNLTTIVTNNILNSIWGNSSENIFTVGSLGTILRNDGKKWTIMNSTTDQNLYGIWGNNDNNIFVVGDAGTILYFDGYEWSKMNSGTTQGLRGIFGISNSNIFAVGNNCTVLHYNGNEWNKIALEFINYHFKAIWGTSSSNLFIVGEDNFGSGIILHYDGIKWNIMNTARYSLRGIWGSSYNNIYAVGDMATLLYYDGNMWSSISGIDIWFGGIWGTSFDNIIAVGTSECAAKIIYYDGITWSTMKTPLGAGGCAGVWGISKTNVWAVGGEGLIFNYNINKK